MKRPPTAVLALLGAVVAMSCSQPAGPPEPVAAAPAAAPAVDTKAVAVKLVKNAAIKEDDVVVITGGTEDWSLLEDLTVEIRKKGAFPLARATSNSLLRRLIDEVPAVYDRQVSTLDLKLAAMADVMISLDFDERDDLLLGVPPERLAARNEARLPVTQVVVKRPVRQINLGNGLLPTAAAARRFAVAQAELTAMYWAAVNTNDEALQARADATRTALGSGRTVRITNPNGTNLTTAIAGRTASQSDGVISAEDIKRGGPALSVWLPAGEAYVVPVPGTAEGVLVADHYFFEGQDVQGLRLTFSKGRITGITATSGLERLKAVYDAAGAGKDELSVVDIGLNPDIRIPASSRLQAWVAAGMVTVGTGNNLWAGGSNAATFSFTVFVPGSTLDVDGRTIVKDGVLVSTNQR